MTTDAFLEAAPIADFERTERYKQPLVIPPGGGKPVVYNRPSSWGKKIEDTYNLELWSRRNVVVGMSRTPALVARACAITADPRAWTKADKEALNAIADEAQTAAKSHQSADIGTAVHRMTERLDLGESLADLPEPYASDVTAYATGMDAHGLVDRRALVECRLVCDELKLAGSADRIIDHRVFDLKTGASIEYSGLAFAVQLAVYAHSDLYDVATGQRTVLDLDTAVALVGHLPAGRATFTLHTVDIAAGWEAALLAADIDRWRKRKGLVVAVAKIAQPAEVALELPEPPPVADLTPAAQIAQVRADPDEGGPADPAAFAALQAKYGALTTGTEWIAGLVRDAMQHGVSFHSRDVKTIRRFGIILGLVTLAEGNEAEPNEALRAILASVIGDVAWFTNVTEGHLVGSLTADEAALFAQRCDTFVWGDVPAAMSPTGRLTLTFAA